MDDVVVVLCIALGGRFTILGYKQFLCLYLNNSVAYS